MRQIAYFITMPIIFYWVGGKTQEMMIIGLTFGFVFVFLDSIEKTLIQIIIKLDKKENQ